jgi:hypothetical protein
MEKSESLCYHVATESHPIGTSGGFYDTLKFCKRRISSCCSNCNDSPPFQRISYAHRGVTSPFPGLISLQLRLNLMMMNTRNLPPLPGLPKRISDPKLLTRSPIAPHPLARTTHQNQSLIQHNQRLGPHPVRMVEAILPQPVHGAGKEGGKICARREDRCSGMRRSRSRPR